MQDVIHSEGIRLAAHVALPPQREGPVPALILAHGFPTGVRSAGATAQTYPELADRIAAEAGWMVLTFNFRGSGSSEGEFSLGGWLQDLRAAVDHALALDPVEAVWLCGASTGGSLAICAGGEDDRVRGVATLAARADFDDWAAHPDRLLRHAREVGVVRDPGYPPDPEAWARELREVRPIALAAKLAPRPLLLIQGSDDDVVPVNDARVLADSHAAAELRVIPGAGHHLRDDPRAVAVLLGWLERQYAPG